MMTRCGPACRLVGCWSGRPDGWAPLAAHLGVPVPGEPSPRVSTREQFHGPHPGLCPDGLKRNDRALYVRADAAVQGHETFVDHDGADEGCLSGKYEAPHPSVLHAIERYANNRVEADHG